MGVIEAVEPLSTVKVKLGLFYSGRGCAPCPWAETGRFRQEAAIPGRQIHGTLKAGEALAIEESLSAFVRQTAQSSA